MHIYEVFEIIDFEFMLNHFPDDNTWGSNSKSEVIKCANFLYWSGHRIAVILLPGYAIN